MAFNPNEIVFLDVEIAADITVNLKIKVHYKELTHYDILLYEGRYIMLCKKLLLHL